MKDGDEGDSHFKSPERKLIDCPERRHASQVVALEVTRGSHGHIHIATVPASWAEVYVQNEVTGMGVGSGVRGGWVPSAKRL